MSSSKEIDARLYNRAVIRLSPTTPEEDVRAFLQGLVTQDTALVAPDAPLWSALLTPQGKALFDFFLFADEQAPLDILIDCEAERANALVKRLSIYRLRRKIDIAVDESLGVFWVNDAGVDKPSDPRLSALGKRWIAVIDSEDSDDASSAYLAHRLSLGVTEGLDELGDGQTLWLETNAIELNGVSFTKGCYVGQENTARMNWRAKVNRRMVVVPIEQADEKRQRFTYPEHGVSIEHRRAEDLTDLDLPEWLASALADRDEAQD